MRTPEQNREYQKQYYKRLQDERKTQKARAIAFEIANTVQMIDNYEQLVEAIAEIIKSNCKL